MGMLTFRKYVAWREGLWMPDGNAIEGLSKLPKPKPPKKPPASTTTVPQVRSAPVARPKTISDLIGGQRFLPQR
jgi:hypothetical protein